VHATCALDLFLKLARDVLHFVQDAQQIAAPQFFDLFFSVAVADEFSCHVERFAGVVPVDDASSVEVRYRLIDQAYFLTAFSMAPPALARSSGIMTG